MPSKDRKQAEAKASKAQELDAADLDKVQGAVLLFDEADSLFGKVKGPPASDVAGSKSGS
jgi:hypothetical protein